LVGPSCAVKGELRMVAIEGYTLGEQKYSRPFTASVSAFHDAV
jgi:hypothetical protein